MQTSLYKRDLMSFFYGNSAYMILGVYAVASIVLTLFWGMYFVDESAAMSSFFAYQPDVLAIIMPAITMRCWAEDKKSGTIESLLTFPLSNWTLVFSKFWATFTLAVIMLFFSMPLLITFAWYVSVDWGNVVCAYVGLVGTIWVLSAAGCMFSSMVSLPITAYLLGLVFGMLWVNLNLGYMITNWWKNAPFYFEGVMDFGTNYQNFVNGQFNPASLVYFASFGGMLLFYNWLIVAGWRTK